MYFINIHIKIHVYLWFFWEVEGSFKGLYLSFPFPTWMFDNFFLALPILAVLISSNMPRVHECQPMLSIQEIFVKWMNIFIYTCETETERGETACLWSYMKSLRKPALDLLSSNMCLNISSQFPSQYIHYNPAFQQMFNFHLPRDLAMVIGIGDSDSNSCFQQDCTQIMLSNFQNIYKLFPCLNNWSNSDILGS